MRRAAAVAIAAALCLVPVVEAGGRPQAGDPVTKASHCKRGEVPRNGRCVRSRKCRRPGLRSIARTSTARLLVTEAGDEVYYGCLFSRDRMVEVRALDEPESSCVHTCEQMHTPRLAGAFAAMIYSWTFSYGGGAPDDSGASVEVYSLRSGRTVRSYPVGSPDVLLLTARGDTVTLESRELRLRRRNGADTLLDSGEIPAASVRLDGSTLSWTNAGEAKQASL
jgi:hypothetical protein